VLAGVRTQGSKPFFLERPPPKEEPPPLRRDASLVTQGTLARALRRGLLHISLSNRRARKFPASYALYCVAPRKRKPYRTEGVRPPSEGGPPGRNPPERALRERGWGEGCPPPNHSDEGEREEKSFILFLLNAQKWSLCNVIALGR
jgi:hypothetical protein